MAQNNQQSSLSQALTSYLARTGMKQADAAEYHGGEIQEGVKVAVEASELCRQAGNIRLLDRIYGIQMYLDRLIREIGHNGSILREALDGPVEY
ncbi:MAG TPA: hypothetical protein VGD98_01295 [Ktedonobacteraceae bacterium]